MPTVKYADLGLVNTKDLFKKAMDGHYAIAAYNFNNMEQLQAIIIGCVETKSPVILQVSSGARKYANQTLLRYMALGAVQMAREMNSSIPIVLHLDHGNNFELCKSCIDSGFSSVMIDASPLPYEDNLELTKRVVEYAHANDVPVEGELGVLAGVEDDVSADVSPYTKPENIIDFVNKTGVDSLAMDIRSTHRSYRFRQFGEEPPRLRVDIPEEIEREIPGLPLVLHSTYINIPEYIDMINKYGGKIENTFGVDEVQLRRVAASAVCKITIDTDGRLAMTAMIRKVLAENPGEFDPRKYLGAAREEFVKVIKYMNEKIFGSAGKA